LVIELEVYNLQIISVFIFQNQVLLFRLTLI